MVGHLVWFAGKLFDVSVDPGQGVVLVEQADVQAGLWIACDSLAGEEAECIGSTVWIDGHKVAFLAHVEKAMPDAEVKVEKPPPWTNPPLKK